MREGKRRMNRTGQEAAARMNRDREKEIIREEEEGKGNREVRRGVEWRGEIIKASHYV